MHNGMSSVKTNANKPAVIANLVDSSLKNNV